MVSHAPCLPKCDHHVQDVISVSAMTQMPKIPFISITTHYNIMCIYNNHLALYACQNHE